MFSSEYKSTVKKNFLTTQKLLMLKYYEKKFLNGDRRDKKIIFSEWISENAKIFREKMKNNLGFDPLNMK